MNLSWPATLAAGLTPFVPGAIVKIAVSITLGRVLLPKFKQTLLSASVQRTDGT
jgi:biotin transporter BioY